MSEVKRDEKGRILPGQGSLNPGGRASKRKELEAWCQDLWESTGKEKLKESLQSKNHKERLTAMKIVLERGYGKPGTVLEDGDGNQQVIIFTGVSRRPGDPLPDELEGVTE